MPSGGAVLRTLKLYRYSACKPDEPGPDAAALASLPSRPPYCVQGLRNLERMRLAELLQEPTPATFASGRAGSGAAAGSGGGGWRRRFQRYRGPFIEQLAVEDLKADPKPWAVFWRGSEAGRWAAAYSLPASLDVLHERTEVRAAACVLCC